MEIRLIAGKGGDGRSSFSQTFQNPYGGPNGGDGGNGAHIILEGTCIEYYQWIESSNASVFSIENCDIAESASKYVCSRQWRTG